ncbi:MAG TPA: DUF4386 domain-containing protein [Candidatus Cybelea sp.]
MAPRTVARVAGAFYLGTIVASIFGEYSREMLVTSGDPAASARNVLAAEALYRWGLAADLVAGICYLVVTLLLYELLTPVNRTLALLAAFSSVIGIAVGAVGGVAELAELVLLGNASYMSAFDPAQLQTLAYVAGKLHGEASLIGLVFFGVYCALIGYLVLKSTFLPKILGVLMAIAGVCYLVNSFSSFVAPALANALSPWILLPSIAGELALTFWLLIAGVNVTQWREQAGSKGMLA